NCVRLYGCKSATPFVKDAFHEYVVAGRRDAVNPGQRGTKAAAHYLLDVPAGGECVLRLRLRPETPDMHGPWVDFDKVFRQRIAECEVFFASRLPEKLTEDHRLVVRQAYAGLLWSKQWYGYIVKQWM